ncbi:MAG TPA: hypothetical protein VF598_01735 [Hymenobacter sp.]|jgi:hypothetical protein
MATVGYYNLSAARYASLSLSDYYTLPLVGEQQSEPRIVVAYQAFAGSHRGATARLVESSITGLCSVIGQTFKPVEAHEVEYV